MRRPTLSWLYADAFLSTLAQVVIGVVLDTLAVQVTRLEPAAALGTMQTNCWIALNVGTLVGSLGGSALLDGGWSKRAVFLLSAGLKLVMLLVSLAVVDPPVAQRSACAAAGARAASLLRELRSATSRRRVWMPALFIWIWSLHPVRATVSRTACCSTPHYTRAAAPGDAPCDRVPYISALSLPAAARPNVPTAALSPPLLRT